ncbi:hypothetical protein QLX08_005251 [Tetragonisca angustula]|uniref:Uncharacterized protein n=1 Tax=Tetragonisca angustula TaxID=166442 RepID=A0AAW0ZYJ4_9HYME
MPASNLARFAFKGERLDGDGEGRLRGAFDDSHPLSRGDVPSELASTTDGSFLDAACKARGFFLPPKEEDESTL